MDHVGIVVNVANGRVNTIEGNTSNMVARRSYQFGGIVIVGYGYIYNLLTKYPPCYIFITINVINI